MSTSRGLNDVATSTIHIDVLISTNKYIYFTVFQMELQNKAKMRSILQAVALPTRSVKKNLEAAEKQYQSEFPIPIFPPPPGLLSSFLSNQCITSYSGVVDRKPGDIEGIADIFFEDFKNFLQTQEIGEESARFVREEMEKTWGDSRLAVLGEDEAQKWILGVMIISYFHLFLWSTPSPPLTGDLFLPFYYFYRL